MTPRKCFYCDKKIRRGAAKRFLRDGHQLWACRGCWVVHGSGAVGDNAATVSEKRSRKWRTE